MTKKVYVVGVSVSDFTHPKLNRDYVQFTEEAVETALEDARISYEDIDQAMCSCMRSDVSNGQHILYKIGMTGIPIHNVSAGMNALFLAKQFIEGGVADCILTVGFEKMEPGPLTGKLLDRTHCLDRHILAMDEIVEVTDAPLTAQIFGNAGLEYMKKHGCTETHLAKIATKNLNNALKNPKAQNKSYYTEKDVLNSPRVYGPLTKLSCSPTTDGASAAILVSEQFVIQHKLQDKAVEILDMEMVTDLPGLFTANNLMKIAGYDMAVEAAKRIYNKTAILPKAIDVVELHDCFATNELICYDALQLCELGGAGKFVDDEQNTFGGMVVVNPSGGLIGKGHPLGATGIAQCAELVWQLRGEAGERQVPKARIGLQHNLGLGGAVVITMYRKGFPDVSANPTAVCSDPGDFKVFKYMKILEEAMATDNDNLIEKVRGIYGFKVKNGPNGAEGYWVINAKEGKGKVCYNGTEKADVTFTINDEDVADLISGKLNPQKAFFQGKIKIQGNMGLAMKLTDLQRSASGRIDAIRSKL